MEPLIALIEPLRNALRQHFVPQRSALFLVLEPCGWKRGQRRAINLRAHGTQRVEQLSRQRAAGIAQILLEAAVADLALKCVDRIGRSLLGRKRRKPLALPRISRRVFRSWR